jgi:hypothetical protein
MQISRLLICSAATLGLSIAAVQARSCSKDIDRMQARIDARLEAIAAAGPFVAPSLAGGFGVQPTPFGIATVEERMGEISRNKVDMVRDSMAKARAANAAGNAHACEQALAQVRRDLRR